MVKSEKSYADIMERGPHQEGHKNYNTVGNDRIPEVTSNSSVGEISMPLETTPLLRPGLGL